jgi:hypothetical protein
MKDYAQEFSKIQETVEEKKQKKVALEERKRILEADLGKLMEQLKGLGLESLEQAEAYLQMTEKELEEGLTRCRQILQAA